jgi:hypothetical protein
MKQGPTFDGKKEVENLVLLSFSGTVERIYIIINKVLKVNNTNVIYIAYCSYTVRLVKKIYIKLKMDFNL